MDLKLFEAAASGNTDFIRPHELDSDVTVPQKNTVLHIAVKSKQKEFAKLVLGLCPSLLRKANVKGDTPLHVAASIGSLELAELLINTAKTLHEDVESQEVNAMKELLRMVNLEKEETALHVAARNGHLGVVKLLMEADPGLLDLVNNADQSPLSLAVLKGFSNIALHILETSPSSPCGGTDRMNALHGAVIDRSHVFEGLMERLVGIRPEMMKEADISNRTPLHYAAYYGDLEAVRLFLRSDSSAAYSDKDEMSPLHVAVYRGKIDVARELIQCCPYIWESLDEKGRTTLHVAVIAGQIKMVQYILKAPKLVGLINEPDKEGNTPLHLAVDHGKYTIISILALDKRVDKHAMNHKLFTAFDIFQSKQPEKSLAVEGAKYLLKGTEGVSNKRRCVGTKLGEGMKGEAEEKGASDSATANEGFNEINKSTFEVRLLVATLIATVTFAAAFTIPGGYKSEGPDEGMPTFIDKAVFKAFIIFDTTAFCFSAATVYLLFYASSDGDCRLSNFDHLAVQFISVAILGMVLAFVTGMHVMLVKSIGLAITAYVMACGFILAFIVYWFFDPRGYPFIGLDWPKRYVREKLIKYGIILDGTCIYAEKK